MWKAHSAVLASLIAAALLAPPLGAQHADAPRWRDLQWFAGVGPSFPSDGDFNDTYDMGAHVTGGATIAALRAVRVGVDLLYGLYPPGSLQGRPKLDGNGYTAALTLAAQLTPPVLGGKFYVVGGGGLYQVNATWLRPDNTIEGKRTQTCFGANIGAGVRFGSRYFAEFRRHTAFRQTENNAGFLPITLGAMF